jgi:hypothetical protein
VYAENLINTPGVEVLFADPETLVLTEESKAILSMAPYKPTALVPFNDWNTPVETPAGQLVNEVPSDRNGVARSTSNVLPGMPLQVQGPNAVVFACSASWHTIWMGA